MKKYKKQRASDRITPRVVKSYMVDANLNEGMVHFAASRHVTVASCVDEAFTEYLSKRLLSDGK